MSTDLELRGASAIGLLGGTFDPPHNGHLLLAECARLEFGLDGVVFLPAGDPYRKTSPAPGAPPPRVVSAARHRIAMTQLAIADNANFALDDRETRREGATYTVDTLMELQDEAAGRDVEFVLILGSDALADMPYWKSPERLFELATVVIAQKGPPPRQPAPPGEIAIPPALLSLLRARWSQRAGRLLTFDRLPETLALVRTMPGFPVSSTLIRERIANGKPVRYLLPEAVANYAFEHGLYDGPGALPRIEAAT